MEYTDGIINISVITKSYSEPSGHPDVKLYLCLVGTLEINLNEEKIVLEKDQMMLVNTGEWHSHNVAEESLAVIYYISQTYISRITGNQTLRFHTRLFELDLSRYEGLVKVLKKILVLRESKEWEERLKGLRYYYTIIFSLMKYFANWKSDSATEKEADIDRINFILNYVHMNYNRQISLQDLSEQLHLSVPYLSKYIKRKFNTGFLGYLNKVRISRTVEELVLTNHSITRIAFDNGFSNLTSFNRIFKEALSLSPSEYREKHTANTKHEPAGISLGHNSVLLKSYLDANPVDFNESTSDISVQYEIDARNSRMYRPIWNNVWSLGSADELLRADVQEQILLVKKEMKIRNVSLWGLFSEEMLIDLESDDQFNFSRLDKVFDFIVNNEMTPSIDIGFHPKELYDEGRVLYYREKKSGYSNQARYKNLISKFMDHCIQRYGGDVAETWKFEQSKDDRLFLHSEQAFFRLFDVIYQTIKTKLPKAKVGGGAVFIYDQLEIFEEYVEGWSKAEYQPDFFSVWIYPYDIVADGQKNKVLKQSDNPRYISDKLKKANEILRRYDFDETPLYVTRWNMSLSSRNYLNDSCYKGTYLLKNLVMCLDSTAGMTYDGISDLLCEHYDTVAPLNGAFGLVTRNSIRKPAYYALYFLGKLGKYLLSCTDRYIMTMDDYGNYLGILFNHCEVRSEYRMQYDEIDLRDSNGETFDGKTIKIKLKLKNVENGRYLIKKNYLNYDEGSVLDEWRRLQYKENLDHDELDYLKSVCRPRYYYETVHVPDSVLVFETRLLANEFQFLQIKKSTS